jgi:hypothetical protein
MPTVSLDEGPEHLRARRGFVPRTLGRYALSDSVAVGRHDWPLSTERAAILWKTVWMYNQNLGISLLPLY